jgi:hypothetical protein
VDPSNISLPKFPYQSAEAKAAEQSAFQSAKTVLDANAGLTGLLGRTPDLERLHDDFLNATRSVHHLRLEVAEVRTELIVQLGDHEALDGVCSFKRGLKPLFDRSIFLRDFPEEAKECAELAGPQLRKRVYPSRSYVPADQGQMTDRYTVVASANGTTDSAPA